MSSKEGAPNNNNIEDVAKSLESLKSDCSRLKAALQPSFENYLRDLAGAKYEQMLRDPSYAAQCLTSDMTDVRIAALDILILRYKLYDEHRHDVEAIVIGNDDPKLRLAALNFLPLVCRASEHVSRIAPSLAGVIRDESELLEIRSQAYTILKRITGSSIEERLDYRQGRFPEDVNWDIVDRYI